MGVSPMYLAADMGGDAHATRGGVVILDLQLNDKTALVTGSTVEGFVKDMARKDGVSEALIEKGFFKTVRPSSLIKRFATSEEVANLVVYVASPKSSATNGAVLRVDGGVVRSIL
jgi:hypothetical protein